MFDNNFDAYGPLNAVDGSETTHFWSTHKSRQWLQIILPKLQIVIGVNIITGPIKPFRNTIVRAGVYPLPPYHHHNKVIEINSFCAHFKSSPGLGANINIECEKPITSRYITIQRMQGGPLNVAEVYINEELAGITIIL